MSNLSPTATPEQCEAEASGKPLVESYPARASALGALEIRRLLPIRQRRLVGPWCFFDRYGPLSFGPEKPMDVAPHPHIGLQTISWLLEGEVVHNDSLECEGLIRPGELGLMTAGRGIAHSEETPRDNSGKLNGVQLWVALPDSHRHVSPQYAHHVSLPVLEMPGGRADLIVGDLLGHRSPAQTYSPIVGAALSVDRSARLELPLDRSFEHGLLVLSGDLELDGQALQPDTLYYLGMTRDEICLQSRDGARAMLIGGAPFRETILMWWNFVARTPAEVAQAREDWENHHSFGEVKAYQGPRLAAPSLVRFHPH